MIVEDYVPPATIERAFEQTGLTRYVATLERGEPLPTLGTLIERGQRLVVFAEEKRWITGLVHGRLLVHPGHAAWRHAPGPAELQALPRRREQPAVAHQPLDPPFPPSPSLNAVIGREAFLRGRIKRCLAERGAKGAIVAVDFYQRTSVIEVSHQLNSHHR